MADRTENQAHEQRKKEFSCDNICGSTSGLFIRFGASANQESSEIPRLIGQADPRTSTNDSPQSSLLINLPKNCNLQSSQLNSTPELSYTRPKLNTKN